ncbi:hypothetical protein BS50DRAFT_283563 [Corynespora cassiicola Philippines]|uniref:Uncharacterized protein n=1 Tax=Corynespora cassiicola Philippines TaxID=1448308 RepID=A0A2T2P199_CORCC|nr:hypothetical protein BS50DRAFT_283563 [Corynespora cassiicola Philippines]
MSEAVHLVRAREDAVFPVCLLLRSLGAWLQCPAWGLLGPGLRCAAGIRTPFASLWSLLSIPHSSTSCSSRNLNHFHTNHSLSNPFLPKQIEKSRCVSPLLSSLPSVPLSPRPSSTPLSPPLRVRSPPSAATPPPSSALLSALPPTFPLVPSLLPAPSLVTSLRSPPRSAARLPTPSLLPPAPAASPASLLPSPAPLPARLLALAPQHLAPVPARLVRPALTPLVLVLLRTLVLLRPTLSLPWAPSPVVSSLSPTFCKRDIPLFIF